MLMPRREEILMKIVVILIVITSVIITRKFQNKTDIGNSNTDRHSNNKNNHNLIIMTATNIIIIMTLRILIIETTVITITLIATRNLTSRSKTRACRDCSHASAQFGVSKEGQGMKTPGAKARLYPAHILCKSAQQGVD